jgi:transposase
LENTTFVAGLRCDGIIAPCVIDGPMNGEAFLAYVEQVLAPTLEPARLRVM